MSYSKKGVKFNDIHTSTFGAYLSKITIDSPDVKKYTVDIPGANGSLDLSGYFGGVHYQNRLIKLVLSFPQRNSELLDTYTNLLNALHGLKADITLDDDKNYHYVGRVYVGKLEKGPVSSVTIECDCEPFKYTNVQQSVTFDVSSVEFPSWVYGDINGDGTVSSLDKTALIKVLGKRSFESDTALRADFDFDGVVSDIERTVFNNYFDDNKGSSSFQDYVESGWAETLHSDFKLRNCKRRIVDFGAFPVNVNFIRTDAADTRFWDLRIDNISQFDMMRGLTSYSVFLHGIHEIMIVTPNTDTTVTVNAVWNKSAAF